VGRKLERREGEVVTPILRANKAEAIARGKYLVYTFFFIRDF
jgi:hypothetical protein